MVAGSNFGCPKITFDRISYHFRSIPQFLFFFVNFCIQNGRRRAFWMSKNHFQSHFLPFEIDTELFVFQFLTKWPPAAILDVRKSLVIAFLAISRSSGHFGCPKFTFDPISGHFRSIRKFIFSWIFFDKMAAGWQNGWDENVNYQTDNVAAADENIIFPKTCVIHIINKYVLMINWCQCYWPIVCAIFLALVVDRIFLALTASIMGPAPILTTNLHRRGMALYKPFCNIIQGTCMVS